MTRALVQGKVTLEGKVTPNRGKPQRLVVHADKKADLGLLARAVNNADTPHASQAPPGVSVILAAKGLDEAKVKKAEDVLATIKGIDAKGSMVDAKKGEILVKLTGVAKEKGKTKEVKLTLDDIRKPLQKAGVVPSSA